MVSSKNHKKILREFNKIDYRTLNTNKILIFGLTGFIGKSILYIFKFVCSHLETKVEITAISRKKIQTLEAPNLIIKYIKPDVINFIDINSFDLIIWGATPTDRTVETTVFSQSIKTVTELFLNLIENLESKSFKGKIVNLSSGIVYEKAFTKDKELAEDSQLAGLNSDSNLTSEMIEYRNFKIQSELLLQHLSKYGAQCSNIRIFSLCGPGMPEGPNYAMSNFIKSVKRKEDIVLFGNPNSLRNFSHPLDLAIFIIKILCHKKMPDSINFGSVNNFSIHTWASYIANLGNQKVIFDPKLLDSPLNNYAPKINNIFKIFPNYEFIFDLKTMIEDTFSDN